MRLYSTIFATLIALSSMGTAQASGCAPSYACSGGNPGPAIGYKFEVDLLNSLNQEIDSLIVVYGNELPELGPGQDFSSGLADFAKSGSSNLLAQELQNQGSRLRIVKGADAEHWWGTQTKHEFAIGTSVNNAPTHFTFLGKLRGSETVVVLQYTYDLWYIGTGFKYFEGFEAYSVGPDGELQSIQLDGDFTGGISGLGVYN